jgi:hypothetical protein
VGSTVGKSVGANVGAIVGTMVGVVVGDSKHVITTSEIPNDSLLHVSPIVDLNSNFILLS